MGDIAQDKPGERMRCKICGRDPGEDGLCPHCGCCADCCECGEH